MMNQDFRAPHPVDVAEILAMTNAREHRLLAGRLVRKQLSFPERAIVSALRVPEGDFRDWTEIRQWAADIAGALGAGSSPRAGQGQRPRPYAGHQKFCP